MLAAMQQQQQQPLAMPKTTKKGPQGRRRNCRLQVEEEVEEVMSLDLGHESPGHLYLWLCCCLLRVQTMRHRYHCCSVDGPKRSFSREPCESSLGRTACEPHLPGGTFKKKKKKKKKKHSSSKRYDVRRLGEVYTFTVDASMIHDRISILTCKETLQDDT